MCKKILILSALTLFIWGCKELTPDQKIHQKTIEYLKRVAHDPESVQPTGKYNITPVENGNIIRMSFRAKNAMGALILQESRFIVMDDDSIEPFEMSKQEKSLIAELKELIRELGKSIDSFKNYKEEINDSQQEINKKTRDANIGIGVFKKILKSTKSKSGIMRVNMTIKGYYREIKSNKSTLERNEFLKDELTEKIFKKQALIKESEERISEIVKKYS